MSEKTASKPWYKHPAFIYMISFLLLRFFFGTLLRNTTFGILIALLFWPALIIFSIYIFKNYIGSGSSKKAEKVQINYSGTDMWFKKTDEKMKAYDDKVYPLMADELKFWREIGDTKEERAKNINKIFDLKNKTLSTAVRYDFIPEVSFFGGPFLQFKLSRNLAAMDSREREFLRVAYLLNNEGKLTNQTFGHYCFALIYADGKASIDSYAWDLNGYQELKKNAYFKRENNNGKNRVYMPKNVDSIKDGPSAVKYYQNAIFTSVDAAITNLLKDLENLDNKDLSKGLLNLKKHIHGSNIWLSDDEIGETIFNNNGKYQLTLGHLDDSNTILHFSDEGSLITIAPPGAGKTQCFVIPNMLNWKGAAVVLDIKGEIYTATHKWREKNIGKVFKFSPSDFKNSNSYNPLVSIRQDPDYIWEDSRFLADMMIVPSKATDPFWENMARDVLTAAIAYTTFTNDAEERPMSKVLDIIYGIDWDEMITSLKTNFAVSSMRRMGNTLSEIDPKQKDSILKTAQSSLSAWQGERISKVTDKSDWSPLDLRDGAPTIYICINPNEIESYLSVIRVIIAQHIRMLTTELPQPGHAPVLFMLDELPRLKKMPPIDEALQIGRQYGLKLWMFAQSYGQLKEAYPDPEGLLGSCVVRTFMNLPLNDEFTAKISDQLGFRHDSLGNSKEKVVEPRELAGPNYKDIILVLATNTKPAKLRKRFAYNDSELQQKINS